MSATRLVAIAALVVTTVATLAAQETAPLTAGVRIRVTLNGTPPTTFIATAGPQRGDTLHLARVASGGAIPLSLAGSDPFVLLSTINALEVSRSQRSYWHVGAGVGALVGMVVGVAVANSESSTSTSLGSIGSDVSRKSLEMLGGLFGGALVGAAIGGAVHSETWETIPVKNLRVAPVSLNRVGFGISLSF